MTAIGPNDLPDEMQPDFPIEIPADLPMEPFEREDESPDEIPQTDLPEGADASMIALLA